MSGSGGCDHFLILQNYEKLLTLSKTSSPFTNLKHYPNPAIVITAATDCTPPDCNKTQVLSPCQTSQKKKQINKEQRKQRLIRKVSTKDLAVKELCHRQIYKLAAHPMRL